MLRVGVDVGGTKIEAVAIDEAGHEMARKRVETPRGSYEGTIATIRDLALEVEDKAGQGQARVGIGHPGWTVRATGLIAGANSTWITNRPFARDIAAALGRECRLSNDANCLVVSEATDGAAAGKRVVFGVILGTGVGGGVVVDGKVIDGANGIAGEWEHNPLPWPRAEELPGPSCYCGRTGCIETWLAGPWLAADHKRVTGQELAGPEIVARAEAGDEAADATLTRWEERLARSLATVINIIDPDAIVLGGGLGQIARLYKNVPQQLARWTSFRESVSLLLKPIHGDSSGVRGAAQLWGANGQ
ncbi:MAG TPA: ROK family protein [Magnetospirillaceae bacterium]|jgi:fructokinase